MVHLGDPVARKEVLQRIAALKPETPPRWGKMTAHQMICHLGDSFRVPMGLKKASPASGPLHRTAVKWLALYLPVRWPQGVPTRPEVDQQVGGTPPGEFRQDRCELIELIERFSVPDCGFRWNPHPVFGRMCPRQWLRWGYLHTDHHLRQFGV